MATDRDITMELPRSSSTDAPPAPAEVDALRLRVVELERECADWHQALHDAEVPYERLRAENERLRAFRAAVAELLYGGEPDPRATDKSLVDDLGYELASYREAVPSGESEANDG